MTITSAKYGDPDGNGTNDYIILVSNSETLFVPLDPDNSDYAEIMRQVQAGTLTIADAD